MLVIKIGGSLKDPDPLLRDVANLREPLILVHGANNGAERSLDAPRPSAADGHVDTWRGEPLHRCHDHGSFPDGLRR